MIQDLFESILKDQHGIKFTCPDNLNYYWFSRRGKMLKLDKYLVMTEDPTVLVFNIIYFFDYHTEKTGVLKKLIPIKEMKIPVSFKRDVKRRLILD